VATLEPVPATGWDFAEWTGADADQLVDNGDGTWSLMVDGPKALTASFTDQFDVSVAVEPQGSGTVSNTPGNPYSYGEVATLEPRPAPGWRFVAWSGADADDLTYNGNGTWSMVMDGSKALTVTYTTEQLFLPLVLRSQ
jgi:hypothetical protein